MAEKTIENSLVQILRAGDLENIEIKNSTSDAKNIAALVGKFKYEVIQDDSRWNPHLGLMVDVIGGMTPDIVIRSLFSGQNRIYIEVKETEPLRYGVSDSQVVRYFLHLIGSTSQKPNMGEYRDIRRAVLLAGPSSWFEHRKNAEVWHHFLKTFGELARCFDITLGEIRWDRTR